MDHAFVLAKSISVNCSMTDLRMALIELRMLVATLVMRYTWTGIPDKPNHWDDEMKPFDSGLIHPLNGKCVLKLELRVRVTLYHIYYPVNTSPYICLSRIAVRFASVCFTSLSNFEHSIVLAIFDFTEYLKIHKRI